MNNQGQLESFDAACDVLDIIVSAKHGVRHPTQAARDLQLALARHMRLHRATYGDDHIRPKHHWNFDIPSQLARDSMVLDAFVIERTHLKADVHQLAIGLLSGLLCF